MVRKRRVDKAAYVVDMEMDGIWFMGYRDEMLKKFGDMETARRFWYANRKQLEGNGSTPPEGWWEAFGPEELRRTDPQWEPWHWTNCDFKGFPSYYRAAAELSQLRAAWIADAYPEEKVWHETLLKNAARYRRDLERVTEENRD